MKQRIEVLIINVLEKNISLKLRLLNYKNKKRQCKEMLHDVDS